MEAEFKIHKLFASDLKSGFNSYIWVESLINANK